MAFVRIFIYIGILVIGCNCTTWAQARFDVHFQLQDAYDYAAVVGATVWVNGNIVGITDTSGGIRLESVTYLDSVLITMVGYDEKHCAVMDIRRQRNLLYLTGDKNILSDIVVYGRRQSEQPLVPQKVAITTLESIQERGAQTTTDALEKDGAAFVQRSQMGGGSPIIRGFEANKLLLVIDGVRMNNAIYRGGHLQNAITLSAQMLSHIEIIYGPGSLMYGSDALGGVIHFRTQEPRIHHPTSFQKVNIQQRAAINYHSANTGKVIHYALHTGMKKWATYSSFSYADYGDLRSGQNRDVAYPDFGNRPYYVRTVRGIDQLVTNPQPHRQIGTAYSQLDAIHKVRFRPNDYHDWLLNVQYSTSSIVPRYDQLTAPGKAENSLKFAQWHYGPQRRLLSSLQYRSLSKNKLYDKVQAIASYQLIGEDRIRRKFQSPERTYHAETVQVFALTADFDKRMSQPNSSNHALLSYGVESHHHTVESNAGSVNISTGEVSRTGIPTRYPSGGSNMHFYGAYISYGMNVWQQRLHLQGGLRWSAVHSSAYFGDNDPIEWPASFADGVANTNHAITWSVGAQLKPMPDWEIRAMASSAFRAPNIDDLGKVRPKNGAVTVPNLMLKPEQAISTELSIGKSWQQGNCEGKLSMTGFHTWLMDAIVRTPSSLLGDTLLRFDGEWQRIHTQVNAAEASVHGFSIQLQLPFAKIGLLKSGINYTRGVQQLNAHTSPLAHIPPLYGQTSLEFRLPRWSCTVESRYNAHKPIERYAPGNSDNEEQTTVDGTPAWITYHCYGQFEPNAHCSVRLGLDNITDLHYRPFSSGISAPGRSLYLGIECHW